jgi:hypothetical protein
LFVQNNGVTKMKILVACEESQAVTIELRKLGHNAYSCDTEPCSGGHPEWHIQGDVRQWLYEDWDMIIAHPPCTYLTNTGVQWLTGKRAKEGRWDQLQAGAEFFKMLLDHPCERIAVENPIMHKYAVAIVGRKHDQLVQPYMFGHPERKATCFWLKGLPKLVETDNVKEYMDTLPKQQQQRLHLLSPSKDRAKLRSKTFTGIAKAIAEQWAGPIDTNSN